MTQNKKEGKCRSASEYNKDRDLFWGHISYSDFITVIIILRILYPADQSCYSHRKRHKNVSDKFTVIVRRQRRDAVKKGKYNGTDMSPEITFCNKDKTGYTCQSCRNDHWITFSPNYKCN